MVQEKKVGICKKIKRRRFACREDSKTKNCPLRTCSSGLLRNVRSQPRVSTFTGNLSITCCCVLLKQGSEIFF